MGRKELSRILYLEDDLCFQSIVGMSLEDIGGYNVKICSTGEEAIAVAEKFVPDLFLLDIVLPDTTGPEVLKELRKNPSLQDIPTVFISASFLTPELIAYRELGVLGIIRKPFDPITISKTIQILYDGDQAKEEHPKTA